MALKHGKADPSLRAAYQESVQLGHELTKKIRGEQHDNDDNDDGHYDDDDEDNDDDDNNIVASTTSKMKKHFNETSADDDDDDDDSNHKFKKLLDMKFMKRASESKLEAQKQEAFEVLKQLKQMEDDIDNQSESDGESDNNEENHIEAMKKKKIAEDIISDLFNKSAGDTNGMQIINGKKSKTINFLPPTSSSVNYLSNNINNSSETIKGKEEPIKTDENPWLKKQTNGSDSKIKKSKQQDLYENKVFLQMDTQNQSNAKSVKKNNASDKMSSVVSDTIAATANNNIEEIAYEKQITKMNTAAQAKPILVLKSQVYTTY